MKQFVVRARDAPAQAHSFRLAPGHWMGLGVAKPEDVLLRACCTDCRQHLLPSGHYVRISFEIYHCTVRVLLHEYRELWKPSVADAVRHYLIILDANSIPASRGPQATIHHVNMHSSHLLQLVAQLSIMMMLFRCAENQEQRRGDAQRRLCHCQALRIHMSMPALCGNVRPHFNVEVLSIQTVGVRCLGAPDMF